MEAMAVEQGQSVNALFSSMPQEKKKLMLDFIDSMDAYFRQDC